MADRKTATKAAAKIFERKGNLKIYRVPWFGKTLFHRFEEHPVFQFLYLTPGLFLASLLYFIKNHERIDAVHAHGFTAALITNWLNSLYHGKRLIVSMHAIYRLGEKTYLALICRQILKSFHRIFCLAEVSRQDLIAAKVQANKLNVYVQWVDQSNFRPRDKSKARQKIGLANKFTVLFVGRLITKKGVNVLAAAAKKLPRVNFIFVGDGPWQTKGRKLAIKYKNIILVGRQSPNKVAYYYNAADITAVPSQYPEGFARVVLESLSSGTPVLAASNGCLPEMITDQVGRLIEPDSLNYYKQIKLFQKNPDKLQALAKNCRPYAENRFSQKHALTIEKSYYW